MLARAPKGGEARRAGPNQCEHVGRWIGSRVAAGEPQSVGHVDELALGKLEADAIGALDAKAGEFHVMCASCACDGPVMCL